MLGTFAHPITLISASGEDRETVEALVDTGAMFTAVPAPLLKRLGLVADQTVTLRLANGQREQRRIGELRAGLNSTEHTTICVFGDPDSPAVIGAHTLEAFLLAVDPVAQRLVPVGGYWL